MVRDMDWKYDDDSESMGSMSDWDDLIPDHKRKKWWKKSFMKSPLETWWPHQYGSSYTEKPQSSGEPKVIPPRLPIVKSSLPASQSVEQLDKLTFQERSKPWNVVGNTACKNRKETKPKPTAKSVKPSESLKKVKRDVVVKPRPSVKIVKPSQSLKKKCVYVNDVKQGCQKIQGPTKVIDENKKILQNAKTVNDTHAQAKMNGQMASMMRLNVPVIAAPGNMAPLMMGYQVQAVPPLGLCGPHGLQGAFSYQGHPALPVPMGLALPSLSTMAPTPKYKISKPIVIDQ